MNKTKEDAVAFAETLEPGEAEIFAKWFDAGEFDKIRGHFPEFDGGFVELVPELDETALTAEAQTDAPAAVNPDQVKVEVV